MEAPRKRITTFGQVVFISFAVVIDGIEFLLDLFAIGVIVNRIIDIGVAIIFFGYALLKGLTFANDWKVYASILGTIIGEFIPGLDIAPFFTLDAWYITSAIKKKDKARQQAAEEEAQSIAEDAAEQERQEWVQNYEQQQAAQTQQEDEETPPEQEKNWQNEDGVGRINPPRFKVPSNPQLAGKPVGNSGIIK